MIARLVAADLAFSARVLAVGQQLLVLASQGLQLVLVGAAFVVRRVQRCPSPDETLSSYVGRADLRGERWARPAAASIDALFVLLGNPPGHCRRNIEPAFADVDPTA